MYINNDIDYLKFLKNKDIYIFGCGINGKKCFNKLESKNVGKIIAFIDNDIKKQNNIVLGKPVLSLDEYVKTATIGNIIIICSNYEKEIKLQLLNRNIHNFISVSQIDFGGGEEYYDESYFEWQKDLGKFGAKIKKQIFFPHIKKDMVLVEFGSGGGFLLKEFEVRERVGIEINDSARASAAEIGIKSYKYTSELPDDYADIIISTSVLEHTENPLGELRELRKKLKDGGKIVFHVPNESCEVEYQKSEINNHLYTWNCLHIGNLFKAAGFFVYSVERIQEMWPSHFFEIKEEMSEELFDAICRIAGKAFNENGCIIVAYK